MDTFLYLTYGDGKATIAIKQIEDIIHIAAAFCSPQDQFARHKGRKIALERLNNKKDFYISFKHNSDIKIKWQVRELVNFVVAGNWVAKLDIENEIETTIFDFITETVIDFPDDIIPMSVHTNTIPTWAKHAAIEKTLY